MTNTRRVVWSIATAFGGVALLSVGAIATGGVGNPIAGTHSNGEESEGGRSPYPEVVPCTGPHDPVNFEVFSVGPSPAGLHLTGTSRRCDPNTWKDGWPNNYVNYSYGECTIPRGATGCAPPLTIQTWPACQRAFAEYSFEGKPLPYRKLPHFGRAEVVDFTFPANRIEVYTGSVTVVIFANSSTLAKKAVRMLRPQERGSPPAAQGDALQGSLPIGLPPPRDGSMEGKLPCRS
jgi:hypothetical protein